MNSSASFSKIALNSRSASFIPDRSAPTVGISAKHVQDVLANGRGTPVRDKTRRSVEDIARYSAQKTQTIDLEGVHAQRDILLGLYELWRYLNVVFDNRGRTFANRLPLQHADIRTKNLLCQIDMFNSYRAILNNILP